MSQILTYLCAGNTSHTQAQEIAEDLENKQIITSDWYLSLDEDTNNIVINFIPSRPEILNDPSMILNLGSIIGVRELMIFNLQ